MTIEPPIYDITHLARRLDELGDRLEITDLVNRQGRWLDEQRFDDARSIFTEDASGEFPSGQVRGVDRLADQARRNHS
jgi:hypothetical protein